jgi:hypothetical protein
MDDDPAHRACNTSRLQDFTLARLGMGMRLQPGTRPDKPTSTRFVMTPVRTFFWRSKRKPASPGQPRIEGRNEWSSDGLSSYNHDHNG